MRYSIFALGAGNMAMAMFANSTDSQATDGVVAAMPATVGDYELVGCASSADFTGLIKIATTEDMDLDFCGASCEAKYMGVAGPDCFCGDQADVSAKKLDAKACNAPCPGNKSQFCGASGATQRRDGAAYSAMSVYQRGKNADPANIVTKTVTSTRIATITSCAPTVTDCPVGKHTQYVVTKTTAVCPRPTKAVEWHKKKIVCYSGHCAPEVPCDDPKHRVVCDGDKCHPERCDTDQWNKLVVCKGDDCHYPKCDSDDWHGKKVVCYGNKCSWEKCYGKECDKKFVCKGDECKHEKCDGDDCHKKFNCDPHGKNCKEEHDPHCDGKDCHKPPPPCHEKDCRKPYPCDGPECHKPDPHCDGKDCHKPDPHCDGKDCHKPYPPPCKDCKPDPHCDGKDCPKPPPPCDGKDCVKPVHPTGSVYPKPNPTHPPIVAGAGNMVANVLGAAAGLLFVL